MKIIFSIYEPKALFIFRIAIEFYIMEDQYGKNSKIF